MRIGSKVLKRRRHKRSSKKGCWIWLAAVLLLVLLAGWRIWRSDFVQMHFVYLWPYQNEILTYSNRNDIDPFLVAAIIKNESAFNRSAVSNVGAIGLMQLMPETAAWIASQMGDKNFSVKHLHDPAVNIRYGLWYLSSLEREFQ